MSDLRIENLVVEYSSGGSPIRPIDGLNLELSAGSLTILLGPSGCGKTTLLSCLGGLLTPTSGQINVGDVDVTALSLNPWMGDFAWSSYAVALKCGWVWRGGADVIRWPVPAFPCCDVPWVGPGMAGWTGAGWWGQAARGWMVG